MTARPSRRAAALGVAASLSLAACSGVPHHPAPTGTAASNRAGQTSPSRPAVLSVTAMRGMTGDDVAQLLGPPQFLRHETPVELWQYRGDGCVLHLFLYRDGDGLRVRHGEVRSRVMVPGGTADRMTGPSADECLVKLAAARPAAAR